MAFVNGIGPRRQQSLRKRYPLAFVGDINQGHLATLLERHVPNLLAAGFENYEYRCARHFLVAHEGVA
jgi:hypothetical protein